MRQIGRVENARLWHHRRARSGIAQADAFPGPQGDACRRRSPPPAPLSVSRSPRRPGSGGVAPAAPPRLPPPASRGRRALSSTSLPALRAASCRLPPAPRGRCTRRPRHSTPPTPAHHAPLLGMAPAPPARPARRAGPGAGGRPCRVAPAATRRSWTARDSTRPRGAAWARFSASVKPDTSMRCLCTSSMPADLACRAD